MHPGLPAPRIAPTLGLLNGFPRRRESREELVVMPQAGAVRAASLKPSWCCSPSICFHCLPSPTNRLCPSPPFSATPTQSGCHRPPAVTRTVPGPSPAALAPHRRTRSPSAEPTHPGEGAISVKRVYIFSFRLFIPLYNSVSTTYITYNINI